ncbi:MAG TPA: NFACT family protein [Candidatus Nanoarchaeia archaeon]|nr:NFACT family protein [Candidatus Nanoarchaeia archaeon]
MKKSLASIELAAIVNELQFLVKGKISKIYDYGEKELLLQLHAQNQGKQLLRIIPGKLLNITDKKESQMNPTGFCMQLRKYLDNASIISISQKGGERIVVMEIEKKEKYSLIIEFFSTGNIIFTDEKNMIIGSLNRQIWKDRVVKQGEKYVFPASQGNWKDITAGQLVTILHSSDKKNLATSLAIELSLGGVYAEELCKCSRVNKDLLPKEVTKQQIQALLDTLTEWKKLLEKPQGYFYASEITPFPLADQQPLKIVPTYNEAINTLNPLQAISPFQKKIAALQKMIAEQEEAITAQEERVNRNRKKGELIYEHYAALSQLLRAVEELRQTKDWKAIEQELKKEKKIKKVDLKDKQVIIDL